MRQNTSRPIAARITIPPIVAPTIAPALDDFFGGVDVGDPGVVGPEDEELIVDVDNSVICEVGSLKSMVVESTPAVVFTSVTSNPPWAITSWNAHDGTCVPAGMPFGSLDYPERCKI